MIKSLAASKAAKLLAACVCPVAGTVALTVAVPQVRSAVHKATAPRQYAKPKTRVRPQMAAVQPPCAEPGAFATQSIAPLTMTPLSLSSVPLDSPGFTGVPGGGFNPGGGPLVSNNPPGGPNVPPPGVVPEPGTWLQLVLGFGVVGMMMRGRWGRVDQEGAELDSEKA
jgi:hypothetical protein